MSSAREQIFSALQQSTASTDSRVVSAQVDASSWSGAERVQRLTQQMEAVHTEVHQLQDGDWVGWINRELPKRAVKRLLAGDSLADQLDDSRHDSLTVTRYSEQIEVWKGELFNQIDAAVTTTRGGIASSGTVVLWPTEEEPRLMSLVPPLHIALLQADQIHDTFEQMMEAEQWSRQMPTNALLISGPSKTADIQQVLAYGVHGPKALIVLILGG